MIYVYASKNNREAGAFASGLPGKVITYNASDYGKGQVAKCDAVVISGTRGKGAAILADHEAAGIPVIVIDYGYIRRVSGVATWETGHWQVGIGGLNRPPAFPCPDDRMKALGVDISGPRTGQVTIVAGQHSGDPSHGLSDADMARWAQSKCDETGGYWRPHPDSPHIEVNAPCADGPLEEWLGKADVVHTLCSTIGLDALIAGVPAVAKMPDRACWGQLSGPVHPGKMAVESLCARLAYGQWTLQEMESGQAASFVLDNMERWHENLI